MPVIHAAGKYSQACPGTSIRYLPRLNFQFARSCTTSRLSCPRSSSMQLFVTMQLVVTMQLFVTTQQRHATVCSIANRSQTLVRSSARTYDVRP